MVYSALFSYQFVVAKDPNPIGSGLGELVFMFLHFTTTLFVTLTQLSKAPDKKEAAEKFWINCAIVLLIIAIAVLVDRPISNWLWSLRKDSF